MMTFLRAALEVRAAPSPLDEPAGRLDDDIDAEVAPWQPLEGLLAEDPDLATVDDETIGGVLHMPRVCAVRRVVREQQGVGRGVDEVVDRDHFDVGRAFQHRLERLPADAAESVDPDSGGHGMVSSA